MSVSSISEFSDADRRVLFPESRDELARKRLERSVAEACSGLNQVIANHIRDEALAFYDRHGDEDSARGMAKGKARAQKTRQRVHTWRGGGDAA